MDAARRATQPLNIGAGHRLPVRVLIVEDDPAMVRMLEGLTALAGLEHLGSVASGDTALGLAPQADVVLLDHMLEGPRTGLDVLREIHERKLGASVILVTAHGSEQFAAEALRAGAADYVVKDATLPQVLPNVLSRVLHLREVERALGAAREQVVRVERRAAIGEITVALSHEMNNPLQALRTELELLRLELATLPNERGHVDAALAQVDRLADVVRRVAELDRDTATSYVAGMKMTDLSGG